uniref:Terminase large subunit gp17-like C-terminal domain-containing protein n=2 Tax=Paracidobacterium acidisoli TaxID=2303751 RepID=A0A372INA1_9BACT
MGAAGCFWREWQDAELTGVARHFFPWWWEEQYARDPVEEHSLTADERALMVRHGLSLGQIAYRRQLQTNFRGLTKQEYAEDANECFLSSGDCVFDTYAIDGRLRAICAPAQTRLKGQLQIWYPPIPGRKYLVAADPAGGGTEGDFSAAQVMDLGTGLQCAELQAKMEALEFAQELTRLGREYNDALMVVERNNHGSGVLAYLHGICRYPSIYTEGGKDGWLTNAVTRPQVLAGLGAALVESPEIFSSERLLKECRCFVRQQNGRTEAQAGEHDDCVMAMAIALAARREQLELRRVS